MVPPSARPIGHPGKRGTGEQLAQRLRCSYLPGIDIVSNEASFDRLAYDLLSETRRRGHTSHRPTSHRRMSIVNLTHGENLHKPWSGAPPMIQCNRAELSALIIHLNRPRRFLGSTRDGLYHRHCYRDNNRDSFMASCLLMAVPFRQGVTSSD